ncbi:Xylulose kinase [Cryptotermes secundus]|uniref:Xylulose kinase n=1 Tax=Cryptotermes secundus TaxID=105785 RepID=A0A2J7QUC0_9NEOP|nr:xylulose kinase isoform X2 [Cryptotermes secundus]PNF32173.1 Xylulose kinase [Cryptotermes secundus]
MSKCDESTYLGFDFSTQQLKAVELNSDLQILNNAAVQFDTDLPEFRTMSGVTIHKDGRTVTAPVLMWVKALDLLLDRLKIAGVDFSRVASLSGTAQQHGSVYWQKGVHQKLQSLQPNRFLHDQLRDAFSLADSPIWQDSSTTEQCQQLENAVGGPEKLAEITGSRAYERFTGSQIAKVYQTKKAVYNNTERISLISSFACSLFVGDYAPIDYADASGMNMMDLKTKEWSPQILQAVAPDVEAKLGTPVPSYTNIGPVSKFYVERFGFNPQCRVIAFTGDNPASLIGMRLKTGDIAVSLGTSDTLFLSLRQPKLILEGHILSSPIDKDGYMALLCFKNGSLTRERIRDSCVEGSWKLFNELLNSTPRGNFGNMGVYYDIQEIIPSVKGDYRVNKANVQLSKFNSKEIEVRALIEGQFLGKRAYAEDLGVSLGENTRIFATGGASNNSAILQVLADVFNSPVYTLEASNSAMLGSAYQAKYGLVRSDTSFAEMTQNLPPPVLACEPSRDANEIYAPMVERYRALIKNITNQK